MNPTSFLLSMNLKMYCLLFHLNEEKNYSETWDLKLFSNVSSSEHGFCHAEENATKVMPNTLRFQSCFCNTGFELDILQL